jgi:hypothetical protein
VNPAARQIYSRRPAPLPGKGAAFRRRLGGPRRGEPSPRKVRKVFNSVEMGLDFGFGASLYGCRSRAKDPVGADFEGVYQASFVKGRRLVRPPGMMDAEAGSGVPEVAVESARRL